MIKSILDSIDLVAKSIKNIKEIHAAIKNGVDYFKLKHPEIKEDVTAMCIELRKTCHSIAVSSSVITNFHFNSAPNEIQSEPTRFNNYFINYKSQSTFAEDQIRALKGSCSKINSHILKYKKEKNKKSILSFFNLKDPKKEAELFDRLEKIHDDETDFHSNVFFDGH